MLKALSCALAVFCYGIPARAVFVPRVPKSIMRGPVCAFCAAPALSPLKGGALISPVGGLPLVPAPGLMEAVLSVPRIPGPVSLSVPAENPVEDPVWGTFQKEAAKLSQVEGGSQRRVVLERIFEGSAGPLADDEKVYPHIITAEDLAREKDLDLDKREIARAVKSLLFRLEKSVWHGRWNGAPTTLDAACCGDAAPKLGHLMRKEGYPADLVEAQFHYYLMFHLDSGQIVVDPTIRQFFGGARAPPEIPRVFVGTIEDLNALFKRFKAAKTTSYEPSRIYFSQAVIRNSKIEDVRLAAEKDPSSPEQRPLLDLPDTLGPSLIVP